MKAAELRQMNDVELQEKLVELQDEQFRLRIQHATGQLEDTARMKSSRREIARIRTILHERS